MKAFGQMVRGVANNVLLGVICVDHEAGLHANQEEIPASSWVSCWINLTPFSVLALG